MATPATAFVLLTHGLPVPLAFSDDGIPWAFIGLVIAAWYVVRGSYQSAEKTRRQLALTDRKRCAHCRAAHPGFAAYCRQCGGKF